MRTIVLCLLLVACSRGKESKDDKKQDGASDCEVAAKRGVEATIAKRRAGNTQPLTPQEQEIPKRLAPALAQTCAEAKWSPEVINCFKTADDIATCKNMLTPEQRGMYTRAAMGAMGMGGGAMPPHGMPPHGAPPAGSGSN